MTKFLVTCTKIYNGTMFVDVENNEEALEIAQRKLNENVDCINWDFGEATADIADEDEEDNHTTPQPKYKVGDNLVHNDNPNANFTIVDIRNGKYECSDGVIQPFDELDDNDEFHLVNNQSLPKYKVVERVGNYKVGECVGNVRWGYFTITEIKDGKYIFENGDEVPIATFDANEDNHVETIHREDFKPFDKVLVRDINEGDDVWICDFFSHLDFSSKLYPYVTCGGCHWEQCVPFNDETEYLVGTIGDYHGKYQTW